LKNKVFGGKVIVGYKNESKRSNKELTFLKTLRSDNKNMSRNFFGDPTHCKTNRLMRYFVFS